MKLVISYQTRFIDWLNIRMGQKKIPVKFTGIRMGSLKDD